MTVALCVLGSGSGGNATLVSGPGCQVLIDAGFSPNEIGARLEAAGSGWDRRWAVILTHTHTDHLYRRCLAVMAARGIPLYCHKDHARQLSKDRHFKKLRAGNLVRLFSSRGGFEIGPGLSFSPVRLPHDCPPTFGFLISAADRTGRAWRLAYLADLGHCPPPLLKKLTHLDLLALEFNHDEQMERRSRRPSFLIDRVLGPNGHLSNRQAAEILEKILAAGLDGGPGKLIQLHLSEECNDRKLAYHAALQVVTRLGAATEIFSSQQHCPGSVHRLGG